MVQPELLHTWNSNFRQQYHSHTDLKSLEFWEEEWDIYGSCMENIDQLNSTLKYFQKSKYLNTVSIYHCSNVSNKFNFLAIDLHQKFPIESILKSSSITRDNVYLVSKISEAIKNKTGKVPLLHCQYVPVDYDDDFIMVEFLNWIGICLDKDYLEPVDCLSSATQFCHSQKVYYSISEEEELEDVKESRGKYLQFKIKNHAYDILVSKSNSGDIANYFWFPLFSHLICDFGNLGEPFSSWILLHMHFDLGQEERRA